MHFLPDNPDKQVVTNASAKLCHVISKCVQNLELNLENIFHVTAGQVRFEEKPIRVRVKKKQNYFALRDKKRKQRLENCSREPKADPKFLEFFAFIKVLKKNLVSFEPTTKTMFLPEITITRRCFLFLSLRAK